MQGRVRFLFLGSGYCKIAVLIALMSVIAAQTLQAQWTEPVPMEPQFGIGIRVPWISNDGLRLYLTAGLATINVTTRDSINGAWGPLVSLPAHINVTGTQTSMCESPSGDTLYFTSNSDEHPQGGYGWLDVYYSVMTDTGWGPAINCGDSVNGPGREWSVGISRDGSMLLLASHGSNGEYNSHKLWYSLKRADGTWSQTILFSDSLNSWMDEENPSLSPDNLRLFFYRSGDLYESYLTGGFWQTATLLPSPVNTIEIDMNPCIAYDGRTLWFRSERTGQNQIYTASDTTVLSVPSREPQSDIMRGDYRSRDLRVIGACPNPFNGSTMIEWYQPRIGLVTLSVYDALGRLVQNLAGEVYAPGTHRVWFEGKGLSSGNYFVQVKSGGEMQQRRILLMK